MSYCSDPNWNKLVERFADGRPICNCGHAYYAPVGTGSVLNNGIWKNRTDLLVCQYGCSTNQLRAKEEIAKKLIKEFKIV